ncbi:MAG TPA: hypothetical protein PLJ60_03775 [Chryseolinea sp.]|nr:hypothetical protein [Chryseolinea sp.]HPH46695.1 hypothetical protein [Chryseolinea sp.]HPM29434.1 hypothetical protein [Chryseolinea sp.]
MKTVAVLILWIGLSMTSYAQSKFDSWDAFAKTKFEPKYYEKLGEYLFYPTFTDELKAWVGKEITIQGFYVPFAPEDGDYIVLSKYPMSQCFFCGGAGPESIVEVNFKSELPKFQIDDLVTVKGKLKLNTDDMDHVNFILTDAVLIKK